MKLQRTRNGNRLASWQLRHFLLLAFLFAPRTVAQTPDINDQLESAIALDSKVPSAADVDRAITLAANYMERTCRPNGEFVYLIDTNSE